MEEEKRPWRFWSIVLLTFVGNLHFPVAESNPQYGDVEAEPVSNAGLGFDGVLQRHDGYIKGETPTIPQTSFRCSAQPYNPGMYADVEANCQVYHVCFENRQESFLCGPGTNFNQRILACDFWYNFNCQDSPSFYNVNAEIGKVPETPYKPNIEQTGVLGGQRPKVPGFSQSGGQRPIPEGGSYQPPQIDVPPTPPPFRPQPPRVQPQPPAQPPPRVRPQSPPRVRPQPPPRPLPPAVQQPVDDGYGIEGSYKPQRPISVHPPPSPARLTTAKPVFPPVVSPPRVSRPPIRPPPVIVSQPIQPSRPRVPHRQPPVVVQEEYDIKGNTGYIPPRQPARIPQPSQPVNTGYPSYPSPNQRQPINPPPRRPYRPPQPPAIQQEHVEVDYVPPPKPKPPSRPSVDYVPPPPVEQVAVKPEYPKPPKQPIDRYDPPAAPKQPPSSPSIITEHQQRRPSPPPSRPQVISTQPRQPPPRQRPVFPPVSDHPNANIKGGPGYRPPPPPPRFEPTRIGSRPSGSTSQTGYQPPPQPKQPQPPVDQSYGTSEGVKPVGGKRPRPGGQVSRKPPVDRPKPPTQTVGGGYRPSRIPAVQRPVQVDHPNSGIKGATFVQPTIPRQPPRVIAPATSVSTVKKPQSGSGYQRPIASRPQPPSAPSSSIKTSKPSIPSQTYEPSRPKLPAVPPQRVKVPSQTTIVQVSGQSPERPYTGPSQFPAPRPIDHPNANIKGGSSYRPSSSPLQPTRVAQPSHPAISHPSVPSSFIEQKTSPTFEGRPAGSGYPSQPQAQRPYKPRGDERYTQQKVVQEVYQPQSGVVSSVKDTSYPKRPPSSIQNILKQQQTDYVAGSSYKRGPDTYPKPEFQQPSGPYQPISTPSRSSQTKKQSSPSQTAYFQENKPQTSRYPTSSGSSGIGRRPDYPYAEVLGHQPPYQPQVFPYRENPDHPNESIKGSPAYRPPPPADYQPAASEIQEHHVSAENESIEPEPAPSSQLGDTGSA